jgi:hypothetical protein
MERWQTAGRGAVVLVHAHRDVRELLDRGQDQVAQEGGAGVLAGTGGRLHDHRESVSSAASMMARICSRLLTLKAGTP